MNGKQYEWNTWGEILIPASDSQVWATYANEFYEGGPAVTFRKLGKGTVTYVGVDSHNGALERIVLKRNYMTQATDSCDGFALWNNGGIPERAGDCTELFRSFLYIRHTGGK